MLAGCHEPWRRQRPNSALLTRPDWQQLLPLVAQVQRHRPDVSLPAILTDRVASAHSLPAVLGWRLWRLLHQPHQPHQPETRPQRPPHQPAPHDQAEQTKDWHQQPGTTVRIVWGEAIDGVDPRIAPDVDTSGGDDEQQSELDRVKGWLHDLLADAGPLDSNEVKREARRADVTDKTLRTARTKLCVVTERRGFGRTGFCLWRLPEDHGSHSCPSCLTRARDIETGTTGTSGSAKGTTQESNKSATG